MRVAIPQRLRAVFMSVAGSIGEPYPHAVKAQHTDTGIVKFPVNVHSLRVERSDNNGYTRVIAKQNDLTLSFVSDDDDCRHLAELRTQKELRKLAA
jgi:hypothetical protein